MLYLRFRGELYDLPERLVAVEHAHTDDEIRARLAGYLDACVEELTAYAVDRPSNGDLIIRPEAVNTLIAE